MSLDLKPPYAGARSLMGNAGPVLVNVHFGPRCKGPNKWIAELNAADFHDEERFPDKASAVRALEHRVVTGAWPL